MFQLLLENTCLIYSEKKPDHVTQTQILNGVFSIHTQIDLILLTFLRIAQ